MITKAISRLRQLVIPSELDSDGIFILGLEKELICTAGPCIIALIVAALF